MSNTKHRLVMTLANAGVPVNTVTLTSPTSAVLGWYTADDPQGAPTQAEMDQGAAILAAFDWSDDAQQAWEMNINKAAAKQSLVAVEAVPIATRAGCYALMLSLQEARAKINELIAAVNTANGTSITSLVTGSTFAEALADVANIIDADIV